MQAMIDKILSAPKGHMVGITAKKAVPVLKKHDGIVVEKVSTYTARIGVVYDNQGRVIEKRETGILPEENQGLPWGTWNVYPYLIEHKGELYVRLTPTYNEHQPASAVYFVNGVSTPKDIALSYCRKQPEGDRELNCFNLKLSNLVEFRHG